MKILPESTSYNLNKQFRIDDFPEPVLLKIFMN